MSIRILVVALALVPWMGDAKEKAQPQPKPVSSAAENFLDVPYLGPERDVDYPNGDGLPNHQTRVNIHIPHGAGPFPALIVVHGGGYMGGSKDEGGGWASHAKVPEAAVQEGFVVINVNYILGEGIHPQVQRDFKTLVRFLRANASKYKIDPNRIGAWGFSAGGWLISSSGFTTASDFGSSSQKSVQLTDSGKIDTSGRKKKKAAEPLAVSFDEPDPINGEYSSRLSAMAFDFSHQKEAFSADDPAVIHYKPDGARNQPSAYETAGEALGIDVSAVALPPKVEVHVPDLQTRVATEDGTGETTLLGRVLGFLKLHLAGEQTRTAAPEFRPNQRIFDEPTQVSIVTSGPDVTVNYTTDGSDPTPSSPIYKEAFSIDESTTIKAIATAPGLRPSGIAKARFVRGVPPPTITGPDQLPKGKVAQPYSVTFTAEGAKVWDAAIQQPKQGKNQQFGLKFDSATASLEGTPSIPGHFTVQVRAAASADSVAGTRLYLLEVEP